MTRTSWKGLLIGVVAVVALSAVASQAGAQWWGCCGATRYAPRYAYYTPSYAAPVGCCYDGGYYVGWRPGPIRRAFFGPYRWYGYGCNTGCNYGCYSGCNGCGYATYSDCCSSIPATKLTPTEPAPQMPTPAHKPVMEPPAPPAATPAEPPLPGAMPTMPKTSATSADRSGILTVWVPFDAKVTINGRATTSTGSRREFVSFGLKPGLTYKYVVHATVVREGKVQEDTQTVTLSAGDITAVAFGFNIQPSEQVASR